MELVKNLGLHRIATVDMSGTDLDGSNFTESISGIETDALKNARTCLEAHENLIEANENNQAKFQDVITYLKKQIQDDLP